MGGGQPYMYQAPVRYSAVDPYNGFNPKSVTQASNTPRPPRPQQQGPLLNFNRHPDSYYAPPYGELNYTPMSRHTRTRVAVARYSQQALRCLQLLAAIGILICVIAIRHTTDNEGWIIRVPPSVDIVMCIYAIYHLARPGKARPPASSASYHFFALCIDAGLVPFFVFTSMLAKQNLEQDPGVDGRWSTYFTGNDALNKVLFSTYIQTVVTSALHMASFVLDFYLVVMFRKIANLPPDLNPLEDNLTSRRKTRHKHKSSSVSEAPLNRFSQALSNRISGVTELGSKRNSARDSMFSEKEPSRVSFFQSRSGQDASYSPHNPRTARLSQVDMSQQMYERQRRASNDSVGDWKDLLPPNAIIDDHSRRVSAMPSMPSMSKRNSANVTHVEDVDESHRRKHQSASQEELKNDNWFVLGHTPVDSETCTLQDDEYEDADPRMNPNSDDYDPYRTATPKPAPIEPQRVGRLYKQNTTYAAVPDEPQDEVPYDQQPLRMNPPTPPTQDDHYYSETQTRIHQTHRIVSPLQEISGNRSHTMTSSVSAATASSQYSEANTTEVSTSSAGNAPFHLAPKGRFYGDLASAMRGVRLQEGDSPAKSMTGSVHHVAFEMDEALPKPATVQRGLTRYSPGKTRPKRYIEGTAGTGARKTARAGDENEENDQEALYPGRSRGTGGTRVVSRSGADVMDVAGDVGLKMGRREVSGKVAEEGRGGWGGGLFMRKISGRG